MKSGLDGDHACWHVGHSRLPHGDQESRGSAPQLVQGPRRPGPQRHRRGLRRWSLARTDPMGPGRRGVHRALGTESLDRGTPRRWPPGSFTSDPAETPEVVMSPLRWWVICQVRFLPPPPTLVEVERMTDILVEHDGPIATVVFNRPAMRNAISLAMWTEIARVTEGLGKDESVRAIVYRGAGTLAFASGADISEFT